MAHPLSQEILYLIIGHLQDEPSTLKACCLAFKALAQCARKQLFTRVKLDISSLEVWKKIFPDSTNSPAHNTRTLSIQTSDLKDDIFLTFDNVIRLSVDTCPPSSVRFPASLTRLHGISTAVESLRLVCYDLPVSEIFDFICSFPLLEDLTLLSTIPLHRDKWTRPQISPRFTGSLELHVEVEGGIRSLIDLLLELPNGLHFKRVVLWLLHPNDAWETKGLVSRCSDTLESLTIICPDSGVFCSIPTPNRNLTFN